MASLPQDPHGGSSLWLQGRFRRPAARKARWRSDWTPAGLVVLLLALFILLSVFLPRNEAIERVKHAAQNENKGGAQHPPEVVILAEP